MCFYWLIDWFTYFFHLWLNIFNTVAIVMEKSLLKSCGLWLRVFQGLFLGMRRPWIFPVYHCKLWTPRSSNQIRLETPSSTSDRVCIFALWHRVWTSIQMLLGRSSTNDIFICWLSHLCLFISSLCFCWLVLLILGKQLWQTCTRFDYPCSSHEFKCFLSPRSQPHQPCCQLASWPGAPGGSVRSDWTELSWTQH